MATSKTAREFILDLEKAFQDEVERPVLLIAKKLAMEALRRVVLKSPVDTGQFRGNWNVAHGSKDLSVKLGHFDKVGGDTIARGIKVIQAQTKPGIVWVSNNLEYAEALENGHSKQAPAGMVGVTYAELSTIVELKP